ncbi:MAG: hypothetical protein EPO65_09245 [Dehalococcoidia bacterium]|nr:MAG: hypothetical protein EPO65_09245 [Dehalococcoidia bacterium]
MTPLSCEEVTDLSGAYALGLLDSDERAAIEEHLATHWHEEYASARAAVLALASAAPEVEPSPELRARVLDAARLEARRENRRWIPGLLSGAAVAALALLALNYSGVLSQNPKPTAPVSKADQKLLIQNTTSGAYLELAVTTGTRANLRLGGLPARPGSEVYQVWVMQQGQPPKSICVINAERDGPWNWDIEVRLNPGDTVAVTVEPDGTRTVPTQSPILVGQYY